MPSRSLLAALLLGAVLSLAATPAVIYEAGEPGLEPPRLLEDSRVQPVYPEQALQDGVQGTVLLRLVVTTDGTVGDLEIFRSPYRGESLAQAAVAAVKQWRYQSARLQGRKVACRIMQTVSFYPPDTRPSKQRGRRARKRKATQAPASGGPGEGTPTKVEAAEPRIPSKVEDAPAPVVRPKAEDASALVVPPKAGEKPVPANPVSAAEKANSTTDAKREERRVPLSPVPEARLGVPAAIDIRTGGPRSLLLGKVGAQVREFLGGAEKRDGGDVFRLPEQGMEVTLAASPEGGKVVAIRYVFTDGAGFSASTLRTRKGLGHGSFCLGIIPAYGRPEGRRESTDGDGNVVLSLEYHREGTRALFVCLDGRLSELTLAAVPE